MSFKVGDVVRFDNLILSQEFLINNILAKMNLSLNSEFKITKIFDAYGVAELDGYPNIVSIHCLKLSSNEKKISVGYNLCKCGTATKNIICCECKIK